MHITRTFFLCLACVANMVLPADAMSDRAADDDHRQLHASISEGYRLSFSLADASILKLSVNHPEGFPVNDAQVVITLIDRQGRHHPTRAAAEADGYRVDAGPHAATLCQVEAEVITGGHLLTDHFSIALTT